MSDAELIAGVRALLWEYNRGIEHWNKTLPVPHVIAKWEADAQLLANLAARLAALTAPGDAPPPVPAEVRAAAERRQKPYPRASASGGKDFDSYYLHRQEWADVCKLADAYLAELVARHVLAPPA